MRNRKIVIISSFLLLLFTISVYAGDADRVGTAAGVQVLVPVGARNLAMGGADIATTRGLEAIYWNPAGLSAMQNNANAQFSTMTIFNDIHVNYVAIGVKSGRFGSIGISLKAFDFGDIPLTTREDMDGISGRTYSPTFVTTGLTYSRMLTDAILVGATGKLVYESIPRAAASAFAFDIGIQYRNLGQIQGLNLGLAVKNIGTNMQYSGSGLLGQATEAGASFQDFRARQSSSDQLPSNVQLGLSYQRSFAENNTVTLSSIFQNNNLDNDLFRFGGEYGYSDLVFLRAGYLLHQNTASENQLYTFTVGLGLHYKVGGTDLTFDYAFRDSQYFDGNNLFSLRIGF